MPVATKRDGLCTDDDDMTLQSLKQQLKNRNKGRLSVSGRNSNGRLEKKKKIVVYKAIARKGKSSNYYRNINGKKKERDASDHIKISSKRKKNVKNNVELDEASRLQRRARYLLIKLKLEQNLIDAYSAEGWKGQSREKIKPEKELLRATKEILKCKLGIREAIRQLDFLSSEGCTSNPAVEPDGSVHHDYIFCAKCKLQDALPDNDIILCDGTCSCAFHQKCLDPPLSSEDIPPEDEGWFCKFCEKKMEIIEATNAHLGTQFPLDSNWEDVFREEAALPDIESSMVFQDEEWPSDDSEDDDYNPNRIETSRDDASGCSSSSLMGSLGDESSFVSGSSGRPHEVEVITGPRKRATVNYLQLHNEMFGKSGTDENDQMSEDEDWGPKKKRKETDAATTLIALGGFETDAKQENDGMRKRAVRLPSDAIQKLRVVFSETELPSRAVRVKLSKQLGLEVGKVNKWFKNARYLALKARKVEKMAEDDKTEQEHHEERGLDDVSLMEKKTAVKAEADMEKLSRIKKRVEELQQVLQQLPIKRWRKSARITTKSSSSSSIMYVPVVHSSVMLSTLIQRKVVAFHHFPQTDGGFSAKPSSGLFMKGRVSRFRRDGVKLVAEFDPETPIEEAVTPPSSWYNDPDFYSREIDRIFYRGWHAVGRKDQVREVHDYFTGRLGNMEYLVCQDETSSLRAFHNVCRHHATLLTSGAGNNPANCFVCPYHGWTYGFDGSLLKPTRTAGIKNFQIHEMGLLPLAIARWGPFILINTTHPGNVHHPGHEWLGPTAHRILASTGIPDASLDFICRRVYTLECNWKVFCDNYLDGGYHVPYAHKALSSSLQLDSYSTEVYERVSIQSCTGKRQASRLGSRAIYAFIYPNFMINRYGPWMDTNLVLPIGPKRCQVVFDYFLEPSFQDDKQFIDRSLKESEIVQEEDIALCTAVQRGLDSPAYNVGRYSPSVEMAMHHFHCLLHKDLSD